MVLEDQRLPVPAGQQARFRDEFYPRLRRLAAVTSSDGSFTPPAISGPTLVLRATYGDRHDLTMSWEWAYEVGDAKKRLPLAPGVDEDFRDPAAERAVLECGLGNRSELRTGVDDPRTPYNPTIGG